jgi:translation initiation factor 2 subunit 2
MDITNINTFDLEDAEACNGLKIDFSKRKKKKRNQNRHVDDDSTAVGQQPTDIHNSYQENEKEYTYDYLVQRAFKHLSNTNPELVYRPSKTLLQPPNVQREGTRKTVITNFSNLCKELNRDKEHVMSYFLTELCAIGSIDGTNRLIVRGKYSPSEIESIARKYIVEYVMCQGCKSLDTLIEKDKSSRLTFLKCNLCQSSVTIKPIVSGFRAKL